MAILAVDEVWLREPSLLVPRQQPLGLVRLEENQWTKGCVAALGPPGLINGKNPFTITGTPIRQGGGGGSGWYFGSGDYLTGTNLAAYGGGTGNEAIYNQVDVITVEITSNANNTAVWSVGNTATDDAPRYVLQNNGGTFRVLDGSYYTAKIVNPGDVVTVVYTYSDINPYPRSFYCNGVKFRTTNGYIISSKNIYLGSGYPTQFTGGRLLQYLRFTNMLWPEQLCAEMTRNPFMFYVPA